MSDPVPEAGAPAGANERIAGRTAGRASGPTVLVVAAIHGNEGAGLRAAGRVVASLSRDPSLLRGSLVVLAGNLTAGRAGVRFVDLDLNRCFTPERVERLAREGPDASSAEDLEQVELLAAIRAEIETARGPVYLVDLHTSSADGPPFLTVGDTLRNRAFASRLPLPKILGLEEQIDGSLLEYISNAGLVTLGVEAGRHDAPESVDRHEAALWLALAAAGALEPSAPVDLDGARRALAEAARGVPRVVEVRYRHPLDAEDQFSMEPGFVNFQPVRTGQRLARDQHGPILSPEEGLVLLPLYQGKGNDGFFVAREVRPFWLGVSALLRRLRLGALVRLLPGVRRHPTDRQMLVVETRIARLYPIEIFHLLGFRKLRRLGSEVTFARRRHDLRPPGKVEV